jgi:hypothetical protein
MNLAALLITSLLTPTQSDFTPLVKSKTFSDESQWKATEACLKLTLRTGQTGSAVVVAVRDQAAWAFSAAHVVTDAFGLEAEFFRKAFYPAKEMARKNIQIVARNEDIDLVLIKIPLDVAATEPAALRLIAPGQRPKKFPVAVLAVGCDDGFSPKCFDCQLLAKRLKPQKANTPAFFWEATNAPREGRSGGGLIDEKGDLIGICAANQDGLGYYTHTDEIHAWLKTDTATKELKWLWEDAKR